MSNNTHIPMEQLAAPAQRALTGAGYTTLEQLARISEAEVKELHGIGPSALKVLREALEAHGMAFAAGMTDDERAIRKLVETWFAASQTGDFKTVLDLMTDDVVFMVPGEEPFGKEAFEATSEAMGDVQMEGASDIREVQILGDWAYLRNYIEITMTPPDGNAPVRRSGFTLTILHKESDGRWRLARDANLLAVEK